MIKNLKKSTISMLTCLMLFLALLPSFSANAETITTTATPSETNYVVLGDSIAYGMSATNNEGYNVMFYNYLKQTNKYKNLTFVNFSKPGDTTDDLIKKLSTKDVQDKLAHASIVNISIGGNNFLGKVEISVAKLFNVENPTGDKVEEAVTNEAKKNPIGTYLKFAKLLSPTDSAHKDFINALQQGSDEFTTNWRTILPLVKSLAPNATIYVNTLYNIFSTSDPFYTLMENLVSGTDGTLGMNGLIKNSSKEYKIVDVHSLFQNYKGDNNLIGFSISKGKFDPHPTNAGHKLIFESMITHVNSVELANPSKKLTVNNKLQLKSKVLPMDATNPDLIWSSSDNKVIEVNDSGFINAKSKGKATITAISKDGNKKASIELNVKSSKSNDNSLIFLLSGISILVILFIFIILKKIKK